MQESKLTQPIEPQTIACGVCLTEIPASVAKSTEGPDYVQHFCGLECYQTWQQQVEPSKR